MIRKAVIDFSAFFGSDRKNIIIKELSVLDLETNCVQHWIFKPPRDTIGYVVGIQHDCGSWYSRELEGHNQWLSKHYHGIAYEVGSSEYSSLPSALRDICCKVQLLYTASNEKAKVLEQILEHQRVVFSLESLGCPPLSSDMLILPPEFKKDKKECL
jgi:hypothetical protein